MGNTSARAEESETQARLNDMRELGSVQQKRDDPPMSRVKRPAGKTKRQANDPHGRASGPKRPD